MGFWEAVNAVATLGSALVATRALLVARQIGQSQVNAAERQSVAAEKQLRLTQELGEMQLALSGAQLELARIIAREQADLSKSIAKDQGSISLDISEKQILLAKRQFLSELWHDMATLYGVGADTGWEKILHVVNTLEKVALSCEGEMVDEAVILRTFRGPFLLHCRQIKRLGSIKGLPKEGGGEKTGEDLINENRALKKMFEKLEEQDAQRDALGPLVRKLKTMHQDKKVSEIINDLERTVGGQIALDVTVTSGSDATDYKVVVTRIRRRKQASHLGRIDEQTISTAPIDSGRCNCCGRLRPRLRAVPGVLWASKPCWEGEDRPVIGAIKI